MSIDSTDKWVTFVYNNPRGYWDDIVKELGEEECVHLIRGGMIHQGCSPTRRTYGINSMGITYVCEWVRASSRQSLEEVKERFRNIYYKTGNMVDGRVVTDKTISWKKIKKGDVVLEGDVRNLQYRILTNIYGKNWEYFENGYYRETKPEYCIYKVNGQKNAEGELIKIV